jgi:hypothetical protein
MVSKLTLLTSLLALVSFSSAAPAHAGVLRRAAQRTFLIGPKVIAPNTKVANSKTRHVPAAPSTTSAAPPAATTTAGVKPLTGSYYTDWTGSSFPPESVDFSKVRSSRVL